MVQEFQVTKLDIKADERGWLAEVLRAEQLGSRQQFGQFLVSTSHPGVIRGNHYHTRKSEWFCALKGQGKLILEENNTRLRQEIPLGEDNMITVKIPPLVTHAIVNTGQETMYLLVYVDEPFNAEDPDTLTKKII